MAKILRVIEPFFIAEVGDKFEFDANKGVYVIEKNEEFYKIAGDTSSEINSSYSSTFEISKSYAQQLLDEGYLEEYVEKKDKKNDKMFVNVFDEINGLIEKYEYDLANVDEEFKNEPECVRLEKTTVLTNLLKVLNYLKDLKK